MKKIVFSLIASIAMLGCEIPSLFLTPAPQASTSDCSNLIITDADINATLDYGKSLLSKGDWNRSYTVNTDQVYASYISAEHDAVVFVDTLALCNARNELKGYASKDSFDVIFMNYDSYTQVDSCEEDGTLLFQFTGVDEQKDYNINLWFTPLEDPNRAQWVMVVFPQADTKNMDKYSNAFYPTLTTC